MMELEVKQVSVGEEACNVTLEAVDDRQTGNYRPVVACNSKLVRKVAAVAMLLASFLVAPHIAHGQGSVHNPFRPDQATDQAGENQLVVVRRPSPVGAVAIGVARIVTWPVRPRYDVVVPSGAKLSVVSGPVGIRRFVKVYPIKAAVCGQCGRLEPGATACRHTDPGPTRTDAATVNASRSADPDSGFGQVGNNDHRQAGDRRAIQGAARAEG